MYNLLIGDGNDIDGMVAYALYKETKRHWMARYVEIHNRVPSGREIGEFAAQLTDPEIERMKEQAESMLLAFSSTIIEQSRPDIEKNAVNRSILDEVKKQNSFVWNASASLVGSIFLSVLVLLGAIFYALPTLKELVIQEISRAGGG